MARLPQHSRGLTGGILSRGSWGTVSHRDETPAAGSVRTVAFFPTLLTYREVKSRFMTSLTGAEMSDNCGLWAPRLISATVVYILS